MGRHSAAIISAAFWANLDRTTAVVGFVPGGFWGAQPRIFRGAPIVPSLLAVAPPPQAHGRGAPRAWIASYAAGFCTDESMYDPTV